MSKDSLKSVVVGFKVDTELYEFLDRLPNKSDYIRRAILSQLGMTCPLCVGTGSVARGIGEHFQTVLEAHSAMVCERCGRKELIPRDVDSIPDTQQPRWEQFLHGGPFFCGDCFVNVPACRACGWRMPNDLLIAHATKSHGPQTTG